MNVISLRNLSMGNDSFAILNKSLARHLALRELKLSGAGSYTLLLCVDPALGSDRYQIVPEEKQALLTAANDCALHAAVGHFLLLSRFDGRGGFIPAAKPLDFTPRAPLRGMYFATHFHNFYHNAPLEKVCEVVEDLALRGCNALSVWFDMHHYTGMDDPEAVRQAERLRTILQYANRIGMGGTLSMLSNEAFAGSPEELRADWRAQGRYHTSLCGHYHLEICPSKEGGIEEILKKRREMLAFFSDLKIDYVVYWPYDQGGCTCERCQPWGANGFIKLLPHFSRLIHELLPQTKIIVSTWYFDKFIDGEWDAFYRLLTGGELGDAAYIMSFFFGGGLPDCLKKGGVPRDVRFIDFPEISMYSCEPWGGFGASLLTSFLQTTNQRSGRFYAGGYPYSEGIYEDCNKFIQLTYYSSLFEDAEAAVRAYVRYHFCVEGAELDELTDALLLTERALARTQSDTGASCRYLIRNTAETERVRSILTAYSRSLPSQIAADYRFRLFYLRAVVDDEMRRCDGYPLRSKLCQECMREINDIYFADERTDGSVRAPVGC